MRWAIIAAMAVSGLALAEPSGGIGLVRLGMGQSEAEAAVRAMAQDVRVIERVPVGELAGRAVSDYVVLKPWERVLTATIRPGVRIQVGFHEDRVIAVTTRDTLKASPESCAAMNEAKVKELRQEYPSLDRLGPDHAEATFYQAAFDGWKLWQSRLSQRSTGDCSLSTEFVSDVDERVAEEWRRGR